MSQITERLTIDDGFVAVTHYPSDNPRGRCLLVPPFRLPAAALEPAARALVDRGLEVVTFDPRDHVGEGSGTIARFRLSSFAEDCRVAIERFEPTCLVAISLGARAALRALASGAACPAAVLLTPVVDLHATLLVVQGRDWFAVPDDEIEPLVPVLDIDIEASRFLRDCETHDLVTAAGTQRDLARVRGRLTFIAGTDDPWVDLGTVHTVADSRRDHDRRTAVRPIESDRHSFHEDPDLAVRLITAMLEEVTAIHDDSRGNR